MWMHGKRARVAGGLAVVSGVVMFGAGSAAAAAEQVSWVEWAWGEVGQPGWVDGLAQSGDGEVQIGYTGDVRFFQTDSGALYWSYGDAYTGGDIENRPEGPDIIAITGGVGLTQTLTFSKPVKNPVMAVLSLGTSSGPSALEFDAPIEIVSQGQGLFGAGTLEVVGGQTLVGAEGNGVIRFVGTFTEISWTAPTYEYWSGFTVGLSEAVACVADFNGDGAVNTVDVLAFLNAWSAQDQSADVNGDGSVNTVDVLQFLNVWASGC